MFSTAFARLPETFQERERLLYEGLDRFIDEQALDRARFQTCFDKFRSEPETDRIYNFIRRLQGQKDLYERAEAIDNQWLQDQGFESLTEKLHDFTIEGKISARRVYRQRYIRFLRRHFSTLSNEVKQSAKDTWRKLYQNNIKGFLGAYKDLAGVGDCHPRHRFVPSACARLMFLEARDEDLKDFKKKVGGKQSLEDFFLELAQLQGVSGHDLLDSAVGGTRSSARLRDLQAKVRQAIRGNGRDTSVQGDAPLRPEATSCGQSTHLFDPDDTVMNDAPDPSESIFPRTWSYQPGETPSDQTKSARARKQLYERRVAREERGKKQHATMRTERKLEKLGQEKERPNGFRQMREQKRFLAESAGSGRECELAQYAELCKAIKAHLPVAVRNEMDPSHRRAAAEFHYLPERIRVEVSARPMKINSFMMAVRLLIKHNLINMNDLPQSAASIIKDINASQIDRGPWLAGNTKGSSGPFWNEDTGTSKESDGNVPLRRFALENVKNYKLTKTLGREECWKVLSGSEPAIVGLAAVPVTPQVEELPEAPTDRHQHDSMPGGWFAGEAAKQNREKDLSMGGATDLIIGANNAVETFEKHEQVSGLFGNNSMDQSSENKTLKAERDALKETIATLENKIKNMAGLTTNQGGKQVLEQTLATIRSEFKTLLHDRNMLADFVLRNLQRRSQQVSEQSSDLNWVRTKLAELEPLIKGLVVAGEPTLSIHGKFKELDDVLPLTEDIHNLQLSLLQYGLDLFLLGRFAGDGLDSESADNIKACLEKGLCHSDNLEACHAMICGLQHVNPGYWDGLGPPKYQHVGCVNKNFLCIVPNAISAQSKRCPPCLPALQGVGAALGRVHGWTGSATQLQEKMQKMLRLAVLVLQNSFKPETPRRTIDEVEVIELFHPRLCFSEQCLVRGTAQSASRDLRYSRCSQDFQDAVEQFNQLKSHEQCAKVCEIMSLGVEASHASDRIARMSGSTRQASTENGSQSSTSWWSTVTSFMPSSKTQEPEAEIFKFSEKPQMQEIPPNFRRPDKADWKNNTQLLGHLAKMDASQPNRDLGLQESGAIRPASRPRRNAGRFRSTRVPSGYSGPIIDIDWNPGKKRKVDAIRFEPADGRSSSEVRYLTLQDLDADLQAAYTYLRGGRHTEHSATLKALGDSLQASQPIWPTGASKSPECLVKRVVALSMMAIRGVKEFRGKVSEAFATPKADSFQEACTNAAHGLLYCQEFLDYAQPVFGMSQVLQTEFVHGQNQENFRRWKRQMDEQSSNEALHQWIGDTKKDCDQISADLTKAGLGSQQRSTLRQVMDDNVDALVNNNLQWKIAAASTEAIAAKNLPLDVKVLDALLKLVISLQTVFVAQKLKESASKPTGATDSGGLPPQTLRSQTAPQSPASGLFTGKAAQDNLTTSRWFVDDAELRKANADTDDAFKYLTQAGHMREMPELVRFIFDNLQALEPQWSLEPPGNSGGYEHLVKRGIVLCMAVERQMSETRQRVVNCLADPTPQSIKSLREDSIHSRMYSQKYLDYEATVLGKTEGLQRKHVSAGNEDCFERWKPRMDDKISSTVLGKWVRDNTTRIREQVSRQATSLTPEHRGVWQTMEDNIAAVISAEQPKATWSWSTANEPLPALLMKALDSVVACNVMLGCIAADQKLQALQWEKATGAPTTVTSDVGATGQGQSARVSAGVSTPFTFGGSGANQRAGQGQPAGVSTTFSFNASDTSIKTGQGQSARALVGGSTPFTFGASDTSQRPQSAGGSTSFGSSFRSQGDSNTRKRSRSAGPCPPSIVGAGFGRETAQQSAGPSFTFGAQDRSYESWPKPSDLPNFNDSRSTLQGYEVLLAAKASELSICNAMLKMLLDECGFPFVSEKDGTVSYNSPVTNRSEPLTPALLGTLFRRKKSLTEACLDVCSSRVAELWLVCEDRLGLSDGEGKMAKLDHDRNRIPTPDWQLAFIIEKLRRATEPSEDDQVELVPAPTVRFTSHTEGTTARGTATRLNEAATVEKVRTQSQRTERRRISLMLSVRRISLTGKREDQQEVDGLLKDAERAIMLTEDFVKFLTEIKFSVPSPALMYLQGTDGTTASWIELGRSLIRAQQVQVSNRMKGTTVQPVVPSGVVDYGGNITSDGKKFKMIGLLYRGGGYSVILNEMKSEHTSRAITKSMTELLKIEDQERAKENAKHIFGSCQVAMGSAESCYYQLYQFKEENTSIDHMPYYKEFGKHLPNQAQDAGLVARNRSRSPNVVGVRRSRTGTQESAMYTGKSDPTDIEVPATRSTRAKSADTMTNSRRHSTLSEQTEQRSRRSSFTDQTGQDSRLRNGYKRVRFDVEAQENTQVKTNGKTQRKTKAKIHGEKRKRGIVITVSGGRARDSSGGSSDELA